MQQDHAVSIYVSCAYLVSRSPTLIEVYANDAEE